ISTVSSDGAIGEPQTMRFADAPSRARRVVRAGDTIVATVRTYLEAIALIPQALDGQICSTGFAVLRSGRDIEPRFLAYWARSRPIVGEIVARSVGVSYPAINASELGHLRVPDVTLAR